MKASGKNPKRSPITTMGWLFCFSLFAGVLLGACADPKDLDPVPQNDTLYALPAGVNAEVNQTFQLGAQRVKGGMATNVSDKVAWASSDENVVKVDSSGKATATGIGTATISTTYEGHTALVNVNVSGRITSVEVEAAPITIVKGAPYKLGTTGIVENFTKRALPAAGQAWGSSDPKVALAAINDGTVIGVSPGTATISLTYKNVVYPRNVTVVDLPLDSVTVTSSSGAAVPTGQRTTLRVAGSFGGGALTQDISSLFTASVSAQDSAFATAALTAVTAAGVPPGEKQTTVVVALAGVKGTIAESITRDFPLTIVDAKSLDSLTMTGVPEAVPVGAEPFTPTFKGTYGDVVDVNTTSPTVSFKAASADDKTRYVEIINGMVYPRLAGTVSILGTVTIAASGQTPAKTVTASADVQIVDAPFDRVVVESAETMPTTTVSVDKSIRLKATAHYGALTQTVTSAVVWVSADPNIAIVSNATGTFGGPGKVSGVSAGGPVEIQAYYRGKVAGSIPVTVVP